MTDQRLNAISRLRPIAAEVASDHRDFMAAANAENQAEAELWGTVLELVLPALPALGSKIHRCRSRQGDRMPSEDYYEHSGIFLDVVGAPGFEKRFAGQGQGTYDGWHMRLVTAAGDGFVPGDLLLVTYSGSWDQSDPDAEIDTLNAELRLTHIVVVGIDQAVSSIAEHLRQQLGGKKQKRTRTMERRAARLTALATLLQSDR